MPAFSCPKCGATIRMRDEYAGRDIDCPRCNQTMRVPAHPGPAPPPVPRPPQEPADTTPVLITVVSFVRAAVWIMLIAWVGYLMLAQAVALSSKPAPGLLNFVPADTLLYVVQPYVLARAIDKALLACLGR